MHTTRIAILLSSVAGIAGCFFKWTNNLVFGQPNTVLGVQYAEGPLIMICFIFIAGMALLNLKELTLNTSLIKAITFFSLLAVTVSGYKIYAVQAKADKIASIQADIHQLVVYQPAIGLYFTLGAAISIVLILILQGLFQRRPVAISSAWMEMEPQGRFFISASQ